MTDYQVEQLSIERLIAALQAAWNAHDFKAYAACFHDDADFINVFGLLRKGRAEIEASHLTPNFLKMFKDSHYETTDMRVRFIRPDVAQIDVRWEMTGSRDPFGHAVPKRYGLLSLIATRNSVATPYGGWLFAVFHNQDLAPPERLAEIAKLLSS